MLTKVLIRRKSVVVFVVLAIGLLMVLSSMQEGYRNSFPTPKTSKNVPSTSPADLWSGNAYFEREKYVAANDCGGPCAVQEESLIQPPTQPANTVYMYYRPHLDDHWDIVGPVPLKTDGGVSLAYSTDGGATFQQANGGHNLPGPNSGDEGLSPGPANTNFCAWDSQHVIAPSVVYVNGVYYMVYEGATIGYAAAYLYCPSGSYYTSGDIGLATSTDGFHWTKQGIILYHNPDPLSFEGNNIGTPSVSYFNNQFYVFYHGDSGFIGINQRNQVGMAHGPDLYHLTKLGNPVLRVGTPASWDSWVTSRASVIWDASSGYYYMTFEGSQNPGCQAGNWGWGIARSTDLQNWDLYPYNPIRQIYQGGCGNDIPYIFQYGGAIRVYQSEPGQANILLTGTDPYLHIYSAINGGNGQCEKYHKLGFVDGDGWAQSTGFLLADYLCYGPYETGLTVGKYAVNFQLLEDTTSGLPSRVATVNINDARSGGSELSSLDINRFDFNAGSSYQNFELQLSATAGGSYEWRTWFTNTAYIRQHYVFVRQLDGSIDTTPPTTSVVSLPTYSPAPVQVSWSGSDTGTGIWYFETQFNNVTNSLGWQEWLSATTSTSAAFIADPCQQYQFRVRAVDYAGNPQDWANAALTSTTVLCGLTVSATPTLVPADGVSLSTITIQAQDNAQGRVISLSTNLGTLSGPSCTTGSSGSCTATISSNAGGVATITATSSNYVTATILVSFSGFGISAAANTGQFGGWTITVASSQGFTGTVTLSDTVPTGLSCSSITPSSITLTASATTGTANLSCTSGVATSYSLTITGTSPTGSSSSITRSYPVSITTDYAVAASPTTIGIPPGHQGSSTISVSSIAGFTASVSLGVTSSPPGLSCTLGNNPVTLGANNPTATSYLTCQGSGGDYFVTVSVISGSTSHVANLVVGVNDFIITTAPAPLLAPGSSWASPITLTPVGGFDGTVTLTPSSTTSITATDSPSVVSLFPGGTGLYDATLWRVGTSGCCQLPFAEGSTGNGYLYFATLFVGGGSVYVNRYAPPGTSSNVVRTITITHFNGALPSNLSAFLTIFYADGSVQTVQLTQSSNTLVTDTINLVQSKTISYVQVSLQVTSSIVIGTFFEYFYFTYGSSLTVTTSPTIQPGRYLVTTNATSPGLLHGSTLLVNIPDFKIAASQSSVNAVVGATASSTIIVTSIGGFNGNVSLVVTTSPSSGFGCSLSPTSIIIAGNSTLSCSGTAIGSYNATVTGTSGSKTHYASVIYNVTDFSISAVSPNAVDVGMFSPTSSCTICYIYVTAVNGFTGQVSLSATPPTGLQCQSITPAIVSLSSNSYATASLSCKATLAGNYNVTIAGANGSLSHTTIMTFTFQDFSLTVSQAFPPTPVGSENSGFFNLVSLPNPATTIYSQMFSDTVTLTASPSSNAVSCWFIGASSSASYILQGGQSFLIVPMTCTGNAAGPYSVNVTASSSVGPLSHSIIFGLTITDFNIPNSTVLFIAGNQLNVAIPVSSLDGFAGNVNVTVSSPAGITRSCPATIAVTSAGGTIQCSLSSSAPGHYVLTLTGTYKCGSCYYNALITHTATINANVVPTSITTASTNNFSPSGSTGYSVTVAGSLSVNTAAMNLTGTLSVTTKDGTGRTLHSGVSTVKIPFNVNGFATFSVETPASSAWLILSGCTIDITSSSQSCSSLSWSPDVNQDGQVNIFDLSAVGGAFGSTPGSSNWNPRADINGDGKVNIIDLSTVGGAFGVDYRPMFVDPGLASYTAPNVLTVAIGASAISTIIYTSTNNFAGNVSISPIISPAGPACSVSPSSVSLSAGGSVSATLSCNIPLGTSIGPYTVAITGTAGTEMDTVLVTIQVTDFTITSTTQSLTVASGSSVSDNVTLASVNGFADSVSLTLALSPSSGLACSISPSAGVPALTAVLSCNGSAGVYTVTVTGRDGQLVHSTSVTITVQDFTLTSSRSSVTVRTSQAGTSTITVSSLDGFAGTVTLASIISPSGLTCTLSPTTISLGSSGTSTLSCSGSAGWYSVNVTATAGTLSHLVQLSYTLTDFWIGASPTTITVLAGASSNSTISLSSLYGFTGTVTLSYSISPSTGLTCSLNPTSITLTSPPIQPQSIIVSGSNGFATLASTQPAGHGKSITPASGSSGTSILSCHGSAGAYTVTVTGSSSPISHSVVATYTVQDFSISGPSTLSIVHGNSGSVNVTLTSLSGFAANVTLSVAISPVVNHGPTGSLSSNIVYVCSPTPRTSNLTISTVSTTPKQQYTVTITATSGSITHTLVLTLTVT